MENILSVEEMRMADQTAIEELGIPGIMLMENAGLKSAQCIAQELDSITGKSIGIFCGKGNNGGDGFVIGRHLNQMGANVHFWLVGKQSEVGGDARTNLDIAMQLSLPISELSSWNSNAYLQSYDILIDALLGTGLKGEVKGIYAKIIESINSFPGWVVAVDTPSGLECDTGRLLGTCVEADFTITMGNVKTGMLLYPGKTFVGDLFIADLNVPDDVFIQFDTQNCLLQIDDYRTMLPDRPEDAYKNTFGKVLVLAGSTGLTGAAMLSSMSALRSGAGMVTLGCPESLNPVFEANLMEVMTVPLPETKHVSIASKAVDELQQALQWSDVIALGPGLSTDADTIEFVHRILREQTHPMVIDADGLNSIAKDINLLNNHKSELILTPHVGELSRLCGLTSEEILKSPIAIVRKFAQKWGVVLLLKGAPTIISDETGRVFFNPSGNSGMATAGFGDVLTGLIAGLLGQGLTAIDATVLGAYMHGLAGDRTAFEMGDRGMVAGDVLENVGQVFVDLEEDKELLEEYSPPQAIRIY